MPAIAPPALTHRARSALYAIAGGLPAAEVAARYGYSRRYLYELASSAEGRAYIATVESEAKRDIAREAARLIFSGAAS
jgi:hypothetical protein